MESKTENPPPAEGDVEPSEARTIVTYYDLLDDRVPAIMHIPLWSAWVCKGDMQPSQFPNLEAYLDEFPFLVTVTDECIVVTDPGFGMGTMEWVFRLLPLSGGGYLAALTETDAHSENHECKIWIGQYIDDRWEDLTEIALPPVTRADFFGNDADAAILEDFELVNLQYTLPQVGLEMSVQPMPNQALECVNGRVLQEDMAPETEARICAAWKDYHPRPFRSIFDPETARFIRKEGDVD